MTRPLVDAALRDLADHWRRRAKDARDQASSYTDRAATARLRFHEAALTFDTCARQLDQLTRGLGFDTAERERWDLEKDRQHKREGERR